MIPALLALEDGSVFYGRSIGVEGAAVGEVVFNTAMTGYQEILTDPSYAQQIVTLTYPQIGNTGINEEDHESDRVWSTGLVIRQTPKRVSSWRQQGSLQEFLAAENVVAISEVDTRRLTQVIREKGALAGCIVAGDVAATDDGLQQALTQARQFPGLKGMDLAKEVTGAQRPWTQTSWTLNQGYGELADPKYKVVAYDFGVKRNILRLLASRGCELTVVPAQTPAAEVLALAPDGIFLSNGPGDPEPCEYAIAAIQALLESGVPIFGICLGHQLLALASGAQTVKMPHGHHGANHPVQDQESQQVIITSQNHGFAVDAESLPNNLRCTHVSLFDGTVQGIARTDVPAFSFQGHPEASPGPQDCVYLFDRFIDMMADTAEQLPMPKRTDIESVLIIGAGPIIIGQACEFDYSGAQACKALREEGYRVVLVNSNPATIMTDPAMADATYIEPVEWQTVAAIIAQEKPDVLLPTMGGQTALNCALDLAREGVLQEHGVELIGASQDAIDKAEDRERFDRAMKSIGLETPRSAIAHSLEEALQVQSQLGFPCVIRPSFTLGGSGGGIAYNREEFVEICTRGLELSPTTELLIDESLLGWKEFEMEVVRDRRDNCIIVCSIENVDPMGVHTGDSITVAPAQTLTDKEYQLLRNASIAVLREIGVDTGGSNVQFAIHPDDGRIVVIEMNPRVSRSSALASKATGFPIAKVAAKLAVGYTLDELENDITGGITPASFEPSIDYVVTKIPRFTFEKFNQADPRLTTQMKSVGEVMAIGRTFQESLQKALRGLETGMVGFDPVLDAEADAERVQTTLKRELGNPSALRLWYVADAFRCGWDQQRVFDQTSIDPWFLAEIEDIVVTEQGVANMAAEALGKEDWYRLKRMGFSDARLAHLMDTDENEVRSLRQALDVRPVYRRVDTCAAEFPASSAYMYSTYEEECEARPTARQKIMVLGGGPNRIGQGIEFDYCCVHAALAMREDGYETIMVNCNPETVSTDYDTSDRLYFEPVTLEDVLAIVDVEQPAGVIVQFGGQTPLNLANDLEAAGVPIIGTSPDAIDRAEDRERFQQLVEKLELLQPSNRVASNPEQGIERAQDIGYPIVVRPSYVLGGRAMEIVYNDDELNQYMQNAVDVSNDSPVLLDRFLDQALEVDVDAVCDGEQVVIGAIMQHIEQAGIHSGDSACSLPPYNLAQAVQDRIRQQVKDVALELGVVGLMNVQMAVQGEDVFVLEVNPRASRTVPFVSKCIGLSLAKVAARCMAGTKLTDQGYTEEVIPAMYHVKESVFPFTKFPGVDPILGPEMKSTGEVMGVGESFGEAFAKASLAVGDVLPSSGRAFISVKDSDKVYLPAVAEALVELGFELVATPGTQRVLAAAGIECATIAKVDEGRPDVADMLKNEQIALIVNTTEGRQSIADSAVIRRLALQNKVCYTTTLAGGDAIAIAIRQGRGERVRRLQDLHLEL